MIDVIINYLVAVGLTILVIIVAVGGFHLVIILRDLSKVVTKVSELLDLSETYLISPIMKIINYAKQYKSIKKFIDLIIKKK